MDARDAEAVSSGHARRGVGLLLTLLAPGLGHIARGRWRRGAIWFAACLSIGWGTCALALLGLPRAFWGGLALIVIVRYVLAPLDAFRVRPAELLPAWRKVALILVGSGLFWHILAGHFRRELVEVFEASSSSMYPTLELGDHFLTTKRPRRFERGDVVVFRFPHEPSIQYVKRLVALGGDTVEVRDGRLFVNGREAARTALDHPCAPEAGAPPCTIWREELGGRSYLVTLDEGPRKDRFGPVTVPAGHAFVIGDHRDHSVDSRSWGTVPDALLVGRPRFVWWSGGNDGVRWGRINAPVE